MACFEKANGLFRPVAPPGLIVALLISGAIALETRYHIHRPVAMALRGGILDIREVRFFEGRRAPSTLLPANPTGNSSRLVARGEISEIERAARVSDRGKRKQRRAVVQREAVAGGAIDDPALKRPNERPQDQRREGAQDNSAEWIHHATLLERDQSGANI
jgi:hypothetical protein